MSEAPAAPTAPPEVKQDVKPGKVAPKKQPPYHVILLDDDAHTYEYVIEMLGQLFGHNPTKAYQLADEVNSSGRAIVDTTTFERAELKRDQIHAFGADTRSRGCKGSMRATIEPAPE